MTDTEHQDALPPADDRETDGPNVAMQIFGFLVAIALVVIAGTFFYDSFTDIF